METTTEDCLAIMIQGRLQRCGDLRLLGRGAKVPNQVVDPFDVIVKDHLAGDPQSVSRALRCHHWIAVPVTTDPGTKAEHTWQVMVRQLAPVSFAKIIS